MTAEGAVHDRVSELLGAGSSNGLSNGALSNGGSRDDSRATSPGAAPRSDGEGEGEVSRLGRSRPRVFPYQKYLPYGSEAAEEQERDMDEMIKHLYVAVAAGDFIPGAVHWTRELRACMSMKFDLTRRQRISLVKLYYELSLAPGLEFNAQERFASMFMVLTKRKHYLRPVKDLVLDWRPLFKELKGFVLPGENSTPSPSATKRNIRTLTKLCTFAQPFFSPTEIPAMLEEFLPFYSMSFSEHAFVVTGLLNVMLPTAAPPADEPTLQPQHYLPTFFHLWSTLHRSQISDQRFLDIFSRIARDCLGAQQVPFGPCGIYTEEQSSLIFTAVLRLLEIPVGQATTPYSAIVDIGVGSGLFLERDPRKHPASHFIARWIVMSISPHCLEVENQKSTLHQLERLIQGIETFFHPSNSGSWTKSLSQLLYYLADFFVMRWNREQSGEYEIPSDRKLTAEVKRRFVLCLRDVVFMGIYAKSGTAMNYSLSTLQSLAYLEPTLILPGALQRIYPAMQGLVEVHRTTSSIRALQMLSRTISQTYGFRCHLTTLLGLALPGIDANDLDKTMHSLAFIQAVCYNIPLHDLTKQRENSELNGDGEDSDTDRTLPTQEGGTGPAVEWITNQVARFEEEGPGIEIDYATELDAQDEEMLLKASTAGFAEFLITFLGRVFTLLQNLPDAARIKTGGPEENIVNTLPATFGPLLASLSPELYDVALEQIARFIGNHVVHQARDAMAFMINVLVKTSPKKALHRLLPGLVASIRTEITEVGAGSTRTMGSEILPRDRALIWHISLLSMCVVHVGKDVLDFQDDLFDIAAFMQDNCKGIPLVHVSNFVHHLLLNLTVTYTIDFSLYNTADLERGLTPDSWGMTVDPSTLEIKWHVPVQEEIDFAVRLFEAQGGRALKALKELTSEVAPVKRDGVGKDWSDDVSSNLVLLRLVLSGVSRLFHSEDQTITPYVFADLNSDKDVLHQDEVESQDPLGDSGVDFIEPEDEKLKRTFRYATGYPLEIGSPQYRSVHELRKTAGETLHKVHDFLLKNQEDDVPCFSALYAAYRSWFVDVGIERSAHVLDRLTRLLDADTHPFKLSGLRKEYPRPLLVRRANLYHFQRMRYNEHPRAASELDKLLILDLAHSSTSVYTDIRRTSQSAGEQAMKSIIGAKPLIIPTLLDALEDALKKGDHPRIKGAVFSLLYGSLAKPIGRNWRFAPRMIKLYLQATETDRPSIQKLISSSSFSIQDMVKADETMVLFDEATLDAIWPEDSVAVARTIALTMEDAKALIPSKKQAIVRRRSVVKKRKQELSADLIETVKTSHWKKANRTAILVVGLDTRFDTISSDGLLELAVKGTIDPHPQLRTIYAATVSQVFNMTQTRALVGHKYENYLLDEQKDPDAVSLPASPDDEKWTQRYLESFAKPEAEAFVDSDYPGWLVWKKTIRGFSTGHSRLQYDDVEKEVRRKAGQYIDRHWLSTLFGYMKQEPRDGTDRFRVSSSMTVAYVMDLMAAGLTQVTFDDFKDLTQAVYGNGSDKHQHRALAEILGAMFSSAEDFTQELRTEIWDFAFPMVRRVFSDNLTPENQSYWATFVTIVVSGKDPRRSWPLVDWLASYRLDMDSIAATKESSKLTLLRLVISAVGWHFQLERPIVQDFLEHLDHPYKAVREVMGHTLAAIFRTRYHESYKDIPTLLEAQSAASSIGSRPYQPTEEFSGMIKNVFERLEKWRLERPAGTQTPTSYTQASKTVLLWLEDTLCNYDCTSLVSFFPDLVMGEVLHMMDIKEDPELQALAYTVFRQLSNVPHRQGEQEAFVASLVKIGREAPSWHQRLRVLINIQCIYFRNIFTLSEKLAEDLFKCVREMLHDVQHEVRQGAGLTLSGMVRCSPIEFRNKKVNDLRKHFVNMLIKNPLPKRNKNGPREDNSDSASQEQNKLVQTRHAAVLGLGALVQAFPYTSPPPQWLPEILATLAGRAASDPGTVGKCVKGVLSDFKKTRQDTWHVDMKAFTQEQLEDLEGVLWKSYFA